MSDEDPELEAFLRSFRPRAPRPLPAPRTSPLPPWWMVAAVVACAVGALLVGHGPNDRRTEVQRPATVGSLGAALRVGRLEAELAALDRHALPNPMRHGSALAVIGDVSRDF